MEQILTFGGRRCTFGSIWRAITKDACVAVFALYICLLILQYEPCYQFNSGFLSRQIDDEHMREDLIKKKYDTRNPFKYYESSEEYYHYRLIQLINDFLTNPIHKGDHGIDFDGEVASVSLHIKTMFNCIVKGLKSKAYLETYYEIQTGIVLNNLSLYEKENKTYRAGLFFSSSNINLSMAEQNYLYKLLHGDFFQKDNVGVQGLSLEKILLKGLLLLEDPDKTLENSVLILKYQTKAFSIVNALDENVQCQLSQIHLCYFKIKLLAQAKLETMEVVSKQLKSMNKNQVIKKIKEIENRVLASVKKVPDPEPSGCTTC